MRKISSDALTASLGDIGVRALGFLATAYLARTLKSDGFGVIGIGMSFLSYAGWFADLGIGTIGTREIAKSAQDRKYSAGEILALKLSLTAVMLALGELVVYLLYPDLRQWRVAALFLLSLLPSAFVIEWYYQGYRDFVQIGISRAIGGLLYLAIVWFAVSSARDIALVPVAFGVSTLGAALWLMIRRRSGDGLFPGKFDLARYRGLLKQTSVIGTGASFGQIVQFLPPVAIGYFCTTKDAGLFLAAMKIVYVMLIADRIFASLFLPTLSKVWRSHDAAVRALLPSVFRALVVGSFSVCTVCSVFSKSIVTLVFGPSFAGAGLMLASLSWFVAWTLLNSFFAYSLIAIGNERSYSRATVIGGIFAAASILASALALGPTAVAVAVSLSEFLIMCLMFIEFRKHFHVPALYPAALSATLAALLIAAARLLGADQLWMAPVVLTGFIGIVMLAGGISIKEIRGLIGT